jgi:hypothetical protein
MCIARLIPQHLLGRGSAHPKTCNTSKYAKNFAGTIRQQSTTVLHMHLSESLEAILKAVQR